MKREITKDCFAKVNLTLDVIGKRPDGYHNLEMIMQRVSLKDILTVSVDTDAEETEIVVGCSRGDVPRNDDNLAAKSARLFLERIGKSAKISIFIEKNIPMGAGLGGGSSDAAGVMTALNELYDFPLTDDELAELCGKIGSDVPFFVFGKTMLAQGTGTELSALDDFSGITVLIAKPEFGVSTPYVYKNLKLTDATKHPDTKAVIEALKERNFKKLAESVGNVLETVTAAEHIEIDEYKTIMMDCGAVYSLMSGSGPSVFGVFEDETGAKEAAEILSELTKEVYITKTE